ncbi:MAG: nitroreductase [Clostridia bacterium]|nr:nitroreductase [Clostridia bacterium]
MNQVIRNIKERRSVRFFSIQPISREDMELIIEAGNYAPTGANLQPWRFVVIQSEEIRKELAKNAKPVYQNYMKHADESFKQMRKSIDEMLEDSIYYSAPAIVFVIGKKVLSYAYDCPMVCENMMLAAKSLGIGSCWLGFGQMGLTDDIRASMEIKGDEEIFGPIVFGYPAQGFPEESKRREPVVKWL